MRVAATSAGLVLLALPPSTIAPFRGGAVMGVASWR